MKRRLTKLVVFLVLGAIVNVAVAWGCAICPIGGESRIELCEQYVFDRNLYLLTTVNILPGEIHLSQRVGRTTILRYNFIPEPIDEADFRALVPRWSRLAASEPFEEFANRYHADHELVDYDEYASGWPAYSLRYFGSLYVVRAGSGNVYDESGMTGYFHPALPQKMVDGGYRSELPFLPIWPGFAINTVFYAAILWLLTLGPFTARRMIRRKRGRCLKCGYDLRGAEHEVCPECGHELTVRARR